MQVLIWTVFSLMLLLTHVHAQEGARKISGSVKDDSGNPIPGVTVTVKGTQVVALTNASGLFNLQAPAKSKALILTSVGMRTKEVVIASSGIMDIALEPLSQNMNEVVVIGYGTAKRTNVTSSIASVSAKDIKDLPVAGVDQALQGKVSGVTVTNNSGQPGGGVSIKVRGVTTINSNDPLIVIDGVPFISNTKSNSGYAGLGGSDGQTGNSVMATLNPNDIESIDVLKDASAQSIYGSQAANGVILITTKKGKAGEGKLNYDVYYGQSSVVKKLDVMNLREFAQYQNEVAPILGATPTEEFKDPSLLGTGTDWQEAMFRKGQVQNHQLSFSGGKDKTNYYLSLNYFDQSGILIGSDFKRYSTRFSLDHQLKSWMKIGVSANASRSIQNVTLADAAEGTIWWGAIQNPLIPVKNIDGTWGGGNTISGVRYGQDNPIARSNMRGNKSTNAQVFGNIYADIEFIEGLNLKNEISYSLGMNNNLAYQLAGDIGT
ncbi:MAG: SusC/RagA family TonB-linked outer membrane protein, partial [Chitinophagaceae bacterium]|nr:SusC/RagA family TonB-linked outer membrane protein [Chitinophagaceae bacterium]